MKRQRRYREAALGLALYVITALAVSVPAAAAAATLNVSTAAQLESAIANAQPGDSVVLAPGVYQLSAPLFVKVDLIVQGDVSAPSIIDGNGGFIFLVSGNNVEIRNLTLRNGSQAIAHLADGNSVLTVSGTTITGSSEIGIATGDGGGHVIVVNSTISGNRNSLHNPPDVVFPAYGVATACASLTLMHVTIADNDIGLLPGACSDDTVTIQNTLIVNNTEDCRLGSTNYAFAGRSSIDSDGTCRTVIPGGGAAFVTRSNVGLGPLADNGGPTMTMAVAASSPATNTGNSTEPFDQRGALRDLAPDIGAFERSSTVSMAAATPGGETVQFTTSVGTFLSFHPVAEADMPNQAGKPTGVDFPYGFFDWSIALPGPSQFAAVTMTFPTAVPVPAQYWKVINTVWIDLCLHVSCVVSGNRLTITLQDGEIGDLDGIGNAVIVDPGGLGIGGATTDVTEPKVHCAAADGQWHATDVTLACTATDDESGLAEDGDASFSLSTSVAAGVETDSATTGTRLVCDAAGNCATAGPLAGNRVDKKGPTIALTSPVPDATYQVGEIVSATYACGDEGSGVNSCTAPVSSGAAIDTSSTGGRTFVVHAVDNVGNPSSTAVTYRVECDYVSFGISPTVVVAGDDVRITGTLRSCSTTTETVALRFTLTGPARPGGCGSVNTTMFTTGPMTLSPGFNKTLSFAHRIPRKTCAGDYSVVVTTLIAGVAVDSAAATVTVRN